MKIILLLKSILLLLLFTNCKNDGHNLNGQKESEKNVIVKTHKINKDSDEEHFHEFLLKFNKDSLFQISRIDFPLKVKESDSEKDYGLSEIIIQKADYQKMDFTYLESYKTQEYDKFEQHIKIKKNRAIIEIRGIDNGIRADYIFEKRKGKWNLATWIDSST